MKILIVEPYFGGSHQLWAEGFKRASRNEVSIISLSANHWKWRMHGAAVELADRYRKLECEFDLILTSDMLDLASFRGLIGDIGRTRTAVYFHENQLTYPWSLADGDKAAGRDNHYAFINYTSALAADAVFFNSQFHFNEFINSLPAFLGMFPDHQGLHNVELIKEKSTVLHLGMNLHDLTPKESITVPNRAVILWNHRWEYDKNPEEFFNALFQIKDRGWEFKLLVLGQRYGNSPKIFDQAKDQLQTEILHWGYCESREEYIRWLHMADILPVTSHQDFFGGSVVEAMYCNVVPLLPKRLAYPEHIPTHLHGTFFYEKGELVNKLQRWIKDVALIRKQSCQQFVDHYDWTRMAPTYDTEFEKIVR